MIKDVKIILILSIILLSISSVKADKGIIIDDITNIDYINSYNYSAFFNGTFNKTFSKTDILLYPDETDILIYLPSPVKTDFEDSYSVGKIYLTLGIMFIIGFGIFLLVIIWLLMNLRKFWRKK